MSRQMLSWGLGWLDAANEATKGALAGELEGQTQGQLAVFALHNARTAVARTLGGEHTAVKAIDAAAPDLKHCRDMLCHFESYIEGKGRLQSKPEQGANAPWLVMWSGVSGEYATQELVFITHSGEKREQTSYIVNLQTTMRVVARAVMAACEEQEVPAPSWVPELARESIALSLAPVLPRHQESREQR